MANLAQHNYLNILADACEERGIEVPYDIREEIEDPRLPIARARVMIDELKFELGWK